MFNIKEVECQLETVCKKWARQKDKEYQNNKM